jgi:hypothetical protein
MRSFDLEPSTSHLEALSGRKFDIRETGGVAVNRERDKRGSHTPDALPKKGHRP